MREKRKIAMLVSNPCNPDFRVIKQAESLAEDGYEVRVFCTWKPGLGIPVHEVVNNVTYVRREWNPVVLLRKIYLGKSEYAGIPKLNRDAHRRIKDRTKQ